VNSMTAVVLCGGVGSRLASVVNDIPKPLADVNGIPFLDILLKWIEKSESLTSIVLAAGHLGHLIESRYLSMNNFLLPIKTVIESRKLGTGGAIVNSLAEINTEHFIVLNGDSFINVDLDKVFSQHCYRSADVTFVVKYLDDTSRFGRLLLSWKSKKIIGFVEKADDQKAGYINCGLYIFRTEFVRKNFREGSFSLEEWFQANVNQHNIEFFTTESDFIDMGTPASYSEIQSFF
jgi:D-glycero-alpha-D-manno-heptose 1-phosphate guanylyltransferase